MRGLWHDIRLGFRSLRKSPGFAVVSMVALALGIGANTAIFSVVDAVLLHPLPYPEPGRYVELYTTDAQQHSSSGHFSYDLYKAEKPALVPLGRTAAYTPWPVTITRPGAPEVVLGMVASASFFPMVDARALLGRLYTQTEESESQPVAVIGEELWRQRFASDPETIGKTIELGHHPYTVIGVLSASLRLPMLPGTPAVWIPLSADTMSQTFSEVTNSLQGAMPGIKPSEINPGVLSVLQVIGKLNPGATAEQMQAAAGAVAKHEAELNPEANSRTGARATSLARELGKGYREGLLLMLGAVGLVLLIACANVANLMVARITAREREMALRLALGAGKGQIARQMLVESVELSLAGGIAGFYLAYLVLTNLSHWVPDSLAQARAATLNGHVLLFAAAVSLGAGILFGAFPVWGIADLKAFDTLKEGGRGLAGGGSGRRLRKGLAVAEVALAVILLVGSGLLLRSFLRVLSVNPGYDPRGLLLAQVNLPTRSYAQPDQWRNFVANALGRLRALPGVEEAAAAVTPPVAKERFSLSASYERVDHPLPPARQPEADILPVSPGYFHVMRTPLVAGREFDPGDQAGSARVCIVNRALARREFGGASPIGKRLELPDTGSGSQGNVACEIVGEVGDEISGELTTKPAPGIYFPFAQFPMADMSFVVRTSVAPASETSAVRGALRDAGTDVPIASLDPVEALLRHTMDQRRFRTLLVGMFAGLAIVLAGVGISGVLGYSVSRRTQEIGVRMALGATPGEVLWQVVGEGLRMVGFGAALGLGAAWGLTRWMRSLLFGIGPADALTYAGVAALLLLVALLACALPALRAARVDPTVALRYE